MRVAMLTTVGDRCGIAAYTRDLLSALRPIIDVDVVPIESGKQPLEHYRQQSAHLNAADVVHIQHEHSFWGGILPNQSTFWNLRYLIQKPVVITAHTTTSLAGLLRLTEERRPAHRLAKELLVRRSGYRDSVEIAPFVTGRCIVHTRQGRDELISRGANPKYVHVIPAGIPSALRPPPASGTSTVVRHLDGRRVVALFGYIAPNKGYEVALEALKRLPPDVMLLIAGGVRSDDMEAYRRELTRRIEAEGLADSVRITGYLTDAQVAELMASAEIVIAPHTYATGSYSITVPLAYGKAIIASDQACFTEIRDQGDILEVVPTGDAGALATAIEGLLSDHNRRKSLESRAQEYAGERSWSKVANQTVAVYREAILDVDRLAHHRQPAGRR
jgi:glycosyltransferase involved in cell wall biosynthesis